MATGHGIPTCHLEMVAFVCQEEAVVGWAGVTFQTSLGWEGPSSLPGWDGGSPPPPLCHLESGAWPRVPEMAQLSS